MASGSWYEPTMSGAGRVGTVAEADDLFRAGRLVSMFTPHPTDNALDAYHALVDGKVSGRAVVVPHP